MVFFLLLKTAALVSTMLASTGVANAELETVKLTHPSGSSAEVFLFGAHVKSFRAAIDPNLDILFMSNESFMDGVRAIRGGIPLVFPNFGSAAGVFPEAKGLPGHGFARVTNWTMASHTDATDKGRASVATFTMASSNSTLAMWPFDFELKYEVKLYANHLKTALHVHNTFTGSIEFHALLHNYLWVDDARDKGVLVSGLRSVNYFDKVAKANMTETRENIDFASQTDNVYSDAPDVISATIKGVNAMDRMVSVKKSGCIRSKSSQEIIQTKTDVVVWNPWADRAKTMEDFGDEEYKNMVAVEPGRVSVKQALPAGETYTLQQTISVTAL